MTQDGDTFSTEQPQIYTNTTPDPRMSGPQTVKYGRIRALNLRETLSVQVQIKDFTFQSCLSRNLIL